MTPHSSAAYSTGTLWRMSLMKEIRTGSGVRQCSRMVPVREVNLLPQQRLTVDGLSEQQELVSSLARHERSEGVHYSHMDLSHPPVRPPGGIVAKQ